MRLHRYNQTLLNRPARLTNKHGFLLIAEIGEEAKFDLAALQELAALKPNARLWVQSNRCGKYRCLRLKPRTPGEPQNLMVARIVAALDNRGPLSRQEVKHRNGNRWDFTARNLVATGKTRCRGSDRTHEIVAHWRLEEGK